MQAATGLDWKPGVEIPGAVPAKLDNDIEGKIKTQGDKVRELKSAKAEKSAIDEAVKALLALKAEYKAASGKDWKPPADPKAAPKKAASPPAKAALELSGPAAQLDAAIKEQGEAVRKLKSEKAEKSAVDDAVKKLLALKADFKAAAGFDWKPAEQKKEGKEKENKKPEAATPKDGEKSDTQKKREAKKAEKANKKAAHKSAEAEEKTENTDDGPDISSGKYGMQEMNQSKEKPNIVLTLVKDLGMKMNEKTVTIRGRLHTSRAKGTIPNSNIFLNFTCFLPGKQCFFVIRQQQVTVQCLAFVNESISKQMVKFIAQSVFYLFV